MTTTRIHRAFASQLPPQSTRIASQHMQRVHFGPLHPQSARIASRRMQPAHFRPLHPQSPRIASLHMQPAYFGSLRPQSTRLASRRMQPAHFGALRPQSARMASLSMQSARMALLFAAVLLLGGCSAPLLLPPSPPTTPASIAAPPAAVEIPALATLPPDSLLDSFDAQTAPRAESRWVDSVLASLTLRERVAQMVTVFAYGDVRGRALRELRRDVAQRRIGGVIVSLGSAARTARLIEGLQSLAAVPLLVSADFETGVGMRLRGGTTFPTMMALGAAGDPDLAYAMGRAVAAEARALGIVQNYAPVADVNVSAGNPVINVRSFGEDPAAVAMLAEASMRGMQDGRMIATAKHFPGHGDTDTDSHSNLPTLPHTRARLDSIELAPFRRLIDAGVLAVMTGHLAAPGLDSTGRPATTSSTVIDTVLRREAGFRGLVVTDALNMKAVSKAGGGNGTVWRDAVLAGADVLLMPTDAASCIDTIAAAVERGDISVGRIERSARRILRYKEWAGLAGRPFVGLRTAAGLPSPLADTSDAVVIDSLAVAEEAAELPDTAAHRALARTIAQRAITLVRNDGALLPLQSFALNRSNVSPREDSSTPAGSSDSVSVGVLSLLHGREDSHARGFVARMRARFPDANAAVVERVITPAQMRAAVEALRDADVIVLASFVNVRNGSGEITFSEDQLQLLERVRELQRPVVLCAMGSPFVATAVSWTTAILCAYGSDPSTQAAMVDVLAGVRAPTGRLPVTLPGIASRGIGLTYPNMAGPSALSPGGLVRIDSLIADAIAREDFPGAQLVVGTADRILLAKTYGRMTYDSASPPVTKATMYDLASLTKVVVTTTLAMRLVDDGRLDLDAPVARYVPEFAVNGKADVRVRNLLLHDAGLAAFRPYHQHIRTAQALRDTVLAERLEYPTGSRTVYSDLGMIALAAVIERITGTRLDTLAARWIFNPLGMNSTMFIPPDSLRSHCAPTENDTTWRHRLLQGEVHDETAALQGGISGNAGVFATADDLALFAQMVLGGGSRGAVHIVRPETVALFTRRAGEHSTRALGWDTKSSTGSSAGAYFPMRAFGHTGFTGTSIWIDPDTRSFVIFLSNRVYPSRSHRGLLSFRAVLHTAVREALAGI